MKTTTKPNRADLDRRFDKQAAKTYDQIKRIKAQFIP